jgi:hypothetical protein
VLHAVERSWLPYPAVIAHVYSSGDAYTARRTRRLRRFRPVPSLGSVTVTAGRAPRWLYRATQRLYALDILRGGNLAAWLQGAPDPQFRLRRGQLSRPWYTTLVLELPPLPLNVAELDKAMEQEAVLAEAAILLAASSSANVIAKRELRGLFLQRGDGKWVKTPQFELFAPTVGVGHSEAALRASMFAAQTAFGSWRAPAPGAMRIDWALKALLTEEPWSQFVWLMFSLEQLVREHHGSQRRPDELARAEAEAYVRAVDPNSSMRWARPTITMRFAAVAAQLSPASGAADTATFYTLKRWRDSMLHGTASEAPAGAMRQAARELTLRYNTLATLFEPLDGSICIPGGAPSRRRPVGS